jgi:asparagine synthase (glutamine-hydrolysing)
MCGIAGVVSLGGCRASDARMTERMLAALAHRGPDDQHMVSDEQAHIGTRRLAIIDLETGRQPLFDESGEVVVSQNGEIYNYIELNDELRGRGHRFSTSHSDTETIAHLYEDLGDRFVERLRGMFAIAIWDRRRRRLVLARDRLGKKPLYWRVDGERLLYGSELKSILADPECPRRIDRVALAQYLSYGYVPSPRSILEGVQKLEPASVLVWDGGQPEIVRYWAPPTGVIEHRTIEEDRERCLELMRESVRLRLRSDVPLGVFLSGGMDSSVVVALMAEASASPIRTYSIGFRDTRFNELPYARIVADRFRTIHTEDIVDLDAATLVPALGVAFDEPFSDASAIPTYRVAQLASREVKVVLTGDGGDESFGGYERYLKHQRAGLPSGFLGALVGVGADVGRRALSVTAPRGVLRRKADTWRRLSRMSDDDRYIELITQTPGDTRTKLLGDRDLAAQEDYLRAVLASTTQRGTDRLQRADLLTYLPEDLLVKMDRATMANSLEARSPLLDHELIEFMMTRPQDRKVSRGMSKVLLREVSRPLLPAPILTRPKRGFSVPINEWFRSSLVELYRDLVLAPDSRTAVHLDIEVAESLFKAHESGAANVGVNLWSLLVFENWARTWLDGGGAGSSDDRARVALAG